MSNDVLLPNLGIQLPAGPLDYRAAAVSCEDALKKLQVSSYARAAVLNPDGPGARTHGESRAPFGAFRHSKDENPHAYYRGQMRPALGAVGSTETVVLDAANLSLALRLSAEARRTWETETGRRRPQDVERELLDKYEGVSAQEAAQDLDVTVRWVRSRRLAKRCDPATGKGGIRDERTGEIMRLREEGLTQREIALEVGLSQTRVSQVLRGE